MQPYERNELNLDDVAITKMGRIAGDDEAVSWYGDISLSARLQSGEVTHDQVEGAFSNMKHYLVRAYRGAIIRCVDGRRIEGYDDNREAMKQVPLGPQVAGGTAGAVVCFKLAGGPVNDTYANSTFEKDVVTYARQIKSMGLEVGGHSDDHATEDKTGCGAIDKLPQILEIMTGTKHAGKLRELVKATLGCAYDAKLYSEILGNAVLLQAEAAGYFKDYKNTIFTRLREQSSGAICKLIGKHNEVAAIVNRVDGYTWQRDEFSSDNKHEIQAFNYDFWASVGFVEMLLKTDENLQKLSLEQRKKEGAKILIARVTYTVATLMALTDGSIDLYVLDEKDSAGNVIDLTARLKRKQHDQSELVAA